MPLYNTLSRNIILPFSDLILGNSISKHLDFLDKSQWWSRGELEAFQEERLQILVKHAYKNVPFYKERFDQLKLKPSDIKSKEDLKKLPILKKEAFRKAFPGKIVAQNLKTKDFILDITSGSTGQPMQYYHTRESHSFWVAAGIRAWYWMGYTLGDKYAKLSQNPRKGFIKKTQDFLNRSDYHFIEQLSEPHFKKVCEDLIRSQPQFIRCYPDPLYFIANYILQNNIKNIRPKAINSTGNILYPEARELIEKAFNAPVYDSYSCEGGPNVAQAPGREVYLSAMEYAISEYLDEDGSDADLDKPGRLIVTDLWNMATPFIRYETHDLLLKSVRQPSCGRQLEPVEKILGRDSDVLITPDGRLVIVHIFTIYFEWKENVDQFQAIQHTETDFEILLKVNHKFTKDDETEILHHWQRYFGEQAHVKIQIADHIPPAPSGKRKFLIRNKNIPLSTL